MKNKLTIQEISIAAMITALIAVMAQVSIPLPITPIPITLQTAGLIITVFAANRRSATLGILVYLLLGAAGMPIFNGAKAGLGILFGPTGGFLMGFLPGVLAASFLRPKLTALTGKKVLSAYLATLALTLIVLFIGVIWFSIITSNNLLESAMLCCIPFLPGDLLKLLIFTPLGLTMENRLKKVVKHA